MVWKAARFALLPLVVAAGCAATPSGEGGAGAAADAPGAVPPDFSLDLTVLTGPGRGAGTEAGDDRLHSGHYVVFCDGSLHWAAGGADPAQGLPPQRRVLDRREMAGLWSLLERLGYADADRGEPPINVKLVETAPGEAVGVCIMTGHGRRWAFVSRGGLQRPPETDLPTLLAHLDRLAWVTHPAAPGAEGRRGAEYGPDPYARYRRP